MTYDDLGWIVDKADSVCRQTDELTEATKVLDCCSVKFRRGVDIVYWDARENNYIEDWFNPCDNEEWIGELEGACERIDFILKAAAKVKTQLDEIKSSIDKVYGDDDYDEF